MLLSDNNDDNPIGHTQLAYILSMLAPFIRVTADAEIRPRYDSFHAVIVSSPSSFQDHFAGF